jgi:hypothetical protein
MRNVLNIAWVVAFIAAVVIGTALVTIDAGNRSAEQKKERVEERQSTLSDYEGKTVKEIKLGDNDRRVTFVFTDSTSPTIESHKYSMNIKTVK